MLNFAFSYNVLPIFASNKKEVEMVLINQKLKIAMKKVILYAVAASMICCNYACNKEDTPSTEEVQPFEPIVLTIDPLTEIGIANSIWYHAGFPEKQPFIDVNQRVRLIYIVIFHAYLSYSKTVPTFHHFC